MSSLTSLSGVPLPSRSELKVWRFVVEKKPGFTEIEFPSWLSNDRRLDKVAASLPQKASVAPEVK
jgi:hypothetical protein